MSTVVATPVPEKTEFLNSLTSYEVRPLWTIMKNMVTPRPTPKATVALWKYKELRPLLLKAGRLVTEHEAERRVLMLVNPSLEAPFTTDSVYAGLQLINPGETAVAHRHRSFAIRFIIEGNKGFTAIGGERLVMEAGDMILTPAWQWHDHGHDGDKPMIWLDGLDLPLYHKLPIHFSEPYTEPTFPSKPVTTSSLKFPWADMKAKLNLTDADSAWQTYRKADGGHISSTLGAHAQGIRAGKSSPSSRSTCSFVFHVKSGSGSTWIEGDDGEAITVVWNLHDTFAVPAWRTIIHKADETEDAYLFCLSDIPLLENLDMYRAE